jgi:hypothetical protein
MGSREERAIHGGIWRAMNRRLCISCYRTGYSECVDVPNSYCISYSNSSLLECPPAVQAARDLIPAVTCLSRVL